MAHPFLDAIHFEKTAPGAWRGQVTEPWYQGRGAYGGLLGAVIMRGMQDMVGDVARAPRSFTVHYCAPVKAGTPVDVTVQVERAGSAVSHVSARVVQDGAVACIASGTFAAKRPNAVSYLHAKMPAAPPAASLDAVPASPIMPAFCQFFEYRFCVGSIPYSGAKEAHLGGWLRPKEPLIMDAALCVAMLDAYPPALLATLDVPRAAATVDLTCHFFEELPLPGATFTDHVLVDMKSRHAAYGYSEELIDLWSETGTLVAQCRQLVAVLG